MRALEVAPSFGLENLRLAERPDPEPGPGEVVLELAAASLNYRDLMMVRGDYNPRQPLPLIPGSDGAGRIVAVGPGVTRWRIGDRALPLFAPRWQAGEPTRERVRATLGGPLDGTLAERLKVAEDGLVATPAHLSDAEAATLACAGLTAWTALVTEGRTRPGDVVVVQGTGGVSLFALQLAQLAGARVIATSSSEEKLERLRRLGAWETIHYPSTPKWGARVREITDGRGADLVVEVGGAGTLEQSLAAVRLGGTIALIGVLAGGTGPINLIPAFMQHVRIQGILVGHRESLEALNRALEAHPEVRPILDTQTFPWTETRAALEHMAAGRHFGKISLGF